MQKTASYGKSDKWYDQAIVWCFYLLAALVPAVFCSAFYSVFSMPKLLLLRFLTLAAVLLWGCKIFVEEKFTYRKSPLNLLLLAYGLVCLATTVFSIAPFTSLFGAQGRFIGIFTIINFLLLPFIAYNFFTKKQIKNLIWVSFIASSLLAIYGILQYFGVWQEGFNWSQDPSERVFGTVGHSNHFGAYLAMNLAAGIFMLPLVKKSGNELFIFGAILLQAVTIFLTASRGALFALFASVFIGCLIYGYRNKQQVKKIFARLHVKVTIAVILFLIALGLITGQIQKIPLVERTVGTLNFINEGHIPDRLSWWMSTFEMIADRPILGFGLSTYRDAFNAYRRTDYVAPGPGNMQDLITPEAAHNEYLNITATQGLLGLLTFLGIIVWVFRKIDQKTIFADSKNTPEEDFYLILSVKCALMVYLIQIFISFGVITTSAIFFLFLGLEWTLTEPENGVKTIKFPYVTRYVAVIFILLVCSFGFVFAAKEAAAEVTYKEAFIAESKGDLKTAIAKYQETILAKPQEFAYFQSFADFALKNANAQSLNADAKEKMLKLAEVHYENAMAINSFHPSIFYNCGLAQVKLYMMTKDETYLQKAEANFAKAVEIAVNNPIYALQAAKILQALPLTKMQMEADDYLKTAEAIRPGSTTAK